MKASDGLMMVLAGIEAFSQAMLEQAKVTTSEKKEEWLSLAEAAKRLGFDDRNATKDVKKLCNDGELIFRKKSDSDNAHYQVWGPSLELYQAKEVLAIIPNKPHFSAYRAELLRRVSVLEDRVMN